MIGLRFVIYRFVKYRFVRYTFRFVRFIKHLLVTLNILFCLQDILKTSSRQVFKSSSRHVLKTSSRHVLQDMSSRCFQNMSWRCLEDVFSVTIFCLPRHLQNMSKTSYEMFSRRLLGRRKFVSLKTCWRPTNVFWVFSLSVKNLKYNRNF